MQIKQRDKAARNHDPTHPQISLAGVAMLAVGSVAADVTSERLINADRSAQLADNHAPMIPALFAARQDQQGEHQEPQARLCCRHRRHLGEREPAGDPAGRRWILYVVDRWGVVYKIDVRSGDIGRIVWRMDPGQEKLPLSNRGAAL
jgi:alcohol dehydrogenase (cytochrome c)